ncbi:MAG: serine/threonine-protein kinase [Pirellulaceae bacterium]
MISPHRTQPEGCGDEVALTEMLEDRLSLEEQFKLTEHLDRCDSCQRRLEGLTANATWWEDTKSVLQSLEEETQHDFELPSLSGLTPIREPVASSLSTSLGDGQAPNQHDTAQQVAADHWVIDLLDTSDEPDALGAIDAMPVDSIVGQGGMGVVLRVRDPELPRHLAVKLLSPMLANSGAARQRFLREAQAAASVVHPNIVPIYSVNAQHKLPYLVMPFVGGGNLQQILDREGPLPLDRVLAIGNQVAEALSEAHAQGIVHRDIKPANLLLDEGGFRVLLTDFGLARALDDATLTASGMIAGTPQFMSPEQAAGKTVDSRSDIYSLGAVLYALATGRPPAHGDSTLDVLRKIHEQDPEPAYTINERLPKWFQHLLDQLMQKDLEARIPRANQAAELIRGALAHVRSPHQVALPESLQPSSGKFAWSKIAMTLVLGAFLLLLWDQPWRRTTPERHKGAGGDATGTAFDDRLEDAASGSSLQPSAAFGVASLPPIASDDSRFQDIAQLTTRQVPPSFTSDYPSGSRSTPSDSRGESDSEWLSLIVESDLIRLKSQLEEIQRQLGLGASSSSEEPIEVPEP